VLAELRKRFKNARLVVTGPLGPHNPTNAEYLNRLVELRRELNIEGAAYFLAELIDRPLSNEVISDLYRLSDLLLFPSREEGFGIPILEAGLAGIPVFCADIAPFRELGGSQVTYFSLDIDPSDLATQLIKSLESSSVFALRKRVLQNYSWEKIYSNKIDPIIKERLTYE
jgi:glycosyltransferase involved in cell wall biosynthesis